MYTCIMFAKLYAEDGKNLKPLIVILSAIPALISALRSSNEDIVWVDNYRFFFNSHWFIEQQNRRMRMDNAKSQAEECHRSHWCGWSQSAQVNQWIHFGFFRCDMVEDWKQREL